MNKLFALSFLSLIMLAPMRTDSAGCEFDIDVEAVPALSECYCKSFECRGSGEYVIFKYSCLGDCSSCEEECKFDTSGELVSAPTAQHRPCGNSSNFCWSDDACEASDEFEDDGETGVWPCACKK